MNNITWHCSVILQNDEEYAEVVDCLTVHVMNHVYHNYKGEAYANQKPIRVCVLAQFIREFVEELTDYDGSHHNPMVAELLCGALQEISFKEIAENLIDDYSSLSAEEVAENEERFCIMGLDNYDVNED